MASEIEVQDWTAVHINTYASNIGVYRVTSLTNFFYEVHIGPLLPNVVDMVATQESPYEFCSKRFEM
jgi:hypothetical protein